MRATGSRLPKRVLVIDDDRRRASATAQWLCGTGWHSSAAGDVRTAASLLSRERFDVVLVDASMRDGDRTLLATVRRLGSAVGIVATVEQAASAAVAIEAFRDGADDVVALPAADEELLAALAKAAAEAGRRSVDKREGPSDGPAPLLPREIESLIGRIAGSRATVLVRGESGTGKSLVAREIHRRSPRRGGPFVEVACGAVCESLLESELFGHVAGAFTGATNDRDGRFLQAHGGTIFLDEIATASAAMQVKLLRVLQERQFEAVGSSETREIDVRVILASHESLTERVAQGRFREDLFWRINVVTIELPPLRERREDIPRLATRFLNEAAIDSGRHVRGFTDRAMARLVEHAWPGNIRELRHAVERAVLLGDGELVELVDVPSAERLPNPVSAAKAESLKSSLEGPERRLIIEALHRNGWCRHAAAKELGINRTSLYKKFKRLGIDPATVGREFAG